VHVQEVVMVMIVTGSVPLFSKVNVASAARAPGALSVVISFCFHSNAHAETPESQRSNTMQSLNIFINKQSAKTTQNHE
jgi:hypothetical protein